jgi:hypothetical protein
MFYYLVYIIVMLYIISFTLHLFITVILIMRDVDSLVWSDYISRHCCLYSILLLIFCLFILIIHGYGILINTGVLNLPGLLFIRLYHFFWITVTSFPWLGILLVTRKRYAMHKSKDFVILCYTHTCLVFFYCTVTVVCLLLHFCI